MWLGGGVVSKKHEFCDVPSFYGETMIDIAKIYMKRYQEVDNALPEYVNIFIYYEVI